MWYFTEATVEYVNSIRECACAYYMYKPHILYNLGVITTVSSQRKLFIRSEGSAEKLIAHVLLVTTHTHSHQSFQSADISDNFTCLKSKYICVCGVWFRRASELRLKCNSRARRTHHKPVTNSARTAYALYWHTPCHVWICGYVQSKLKYVRAHIVYRHTIMWRWPVTWLPPPVANICCTARWLMWTRLTGGWNDFMLCPAVIAKNEYCVCFIVLIRGQIFNMNSTLKSFFVCALLINQITTEPIQFYDGCEQRRSESNLLISTFTKHLLTSCEWNARVICYRHLWSHTAYNTKYNRIHTHTQQSPIQPPPIRPPTASVFIFIPLPASFVASILDIHKIFTFEVIRHTTCAMIYAWSLRVRRRASVFLFVCVRVCLCEHCVGAHVESV